MIFSWEIWFCSAFAICWQKVCKNWAKWIIDSISRTTTSSPTRLDERKCSIILHSSSSHHHRTRLYKINPGFHYIHHFNFLLSSSESVNTIANSVQNSLRIIHQNYDTHWQVSFTIYYHNAIPVLNYGSLKFIFSIPAQGIFSQQVLCLGTEVIFDPSLLHIIKFDTN